MKSGNYEFLGLLCKLYLAALLVALPLYTGEGYWNLGDTKYMLFKNVSCLCLGLWLVVGICGTDMRSFRKWRKAVSMMDLAMAAYGIIVVLSALLSDYGQLAWKLRTAPRLVNLERTNIRYVTEEQVPEGLDFLSVDVSFISLGLVLPVVYRLLKPGSRMVCLVKPQFEAGREKVGKKGVVRDPDIHREVIGKVLDVARDLGFSPQGLTFSPVKGPEGNIEYLLLLQRENRDPAVAPEEVDRVVAESHACLDRDREKAGGH